jgi:hypothetical protein
VHQYAIAQMNVIANDPQSFQAAMVNLSRAKIERGYVSPYGAPT